MHPLNPPTMRLRNTLVAVVVIALVGGIGTGTASAKGGCKKAAKDPVEKIGGEDWFLVKPRQLKIPPAEGFQGYGVWLIAGRIYGGPANGQIGTWIRFKLVPQASGLLHLLRRGSQDRGPRTGCRPGP